MYFLVIFVLIFFGCDSHTTRVTTPEKPFTEMVQFTAPLQGYLGDSTRSNFSYTFSLGMHEVTQEEYALFDKDPDHPNLHKGIPVTDVSWFDAILFCNAMSNLDGFDSVYSYTAIGKSGTRSTITSLDGLVADYSKNGYRLPTEAEWEFASRGESGSVYAWGSKRDSILATSFSWFQDNSGDSLHPICARKPNNELCDMSGNVMEWVDGWFGEIPRDSVKDFIGSLLPNNASQRIVKGGSYQSSLLELNLTRRKDLYDVFSNTRTNYIGFRVARGAIPSPRYSNNGTSVEIQGKPLHLSVTKTQLTHFLGTTQARMVLVNGSSQSLALVDFGAASISIREAPEPTSSLHPSISPDGNYIAYATRKEGQVGTSLIYTRNFGHTSVPNKIGNGWIPRWTVSPSSKDTLLLFTSQASSNQDSLEWSNEFTYSLPVKEGRGISAQVQTVPYGAFHDGTSSDHQFWVTGFTDLRLYDASNQVTYSLFSFPQNGKTEQASTQVCNVSISSGDAPMIAFLDFGFTGVSKIVGKSYRSHEYAFFLDARTRTIVDTLQVPHPWMSWENLEWSNHPNFLVATVTDSTEVNKAVYIIRKSDHQLLKVIEGENVQMPSLWLLSDTTLNPSSDSLFMYHVPDYGVWTQSYGIQLIRFWETFANTTTYALGSSRTLHGIDPEYFSSDNLVNLGVVAADLYTILDIWKNYLSTHATKLKTVVLEVSLDFMFFTQESHFDPIYAHSYGRAYDSIHSIWSNPLNDSEKQLVSMVSLPDVASAFTPDGYVKRMESGFGDIPLDVNYGTGFRDHPESWHPTFDSLVAQLERIKDKDIKVIAILFPQNPEYIKLDLYGRYGPNLSVAQEITDSLFSLSRKYPFFHVFDEHKLGKHDYSQKEASDYDHLNYLGAKKITSRLDSFVNSWKKH